MSLDDANSYLGCANDVGSDKMKSDCRYSILISGINTYFHSGR